MIVSRGLGLGGVGSLVAAGVGISLYLAVVPPEQTQTYFNQSTNTYTASGTGRIIRPQIRTSITLPALEIEGLLGQIEARGSAHVALYGFETVSQLGSYRPTGASKAKLIAVSSQSDLGQILAKGAHDISDEEIASMILSLLYA